jgi:hypothetical protein
MQIFPELDKKFHALDGIRNSLPISQQSATCFYPEQDKPSLRSQFCLSSHLRLSLSSGLLLSGFLTENLYESSRLKQMEALCLSVEKG